eukprot:c10611_g2_i1.p1 GENE.c10611_g2_i1~~c10611_g2_i1.p1  ORF type:complete len:648 (-),score=182.03 c10611_g2_i1:82-2025(-)
MRTIFLTFNLGGYFDDPHFENYRDVWVDYVGKIVRSSNPAFFAVHFQELGGKDKRVELVGDVIQTLEANLNIAGYWSSGLIASLDTSGEFTALGTLVFLKHDLVQGSTVWHFPSSTFVPLTSLTAAEGEAKLNDHAQHKRIMFGPALSRKGFLFTRWHVAGISQSLTLVNLHLVHDESNLVATVEPFPSSYAIRRLRALNAILNATSVFNDLAFIFGDFNFRLDLNHFVPWVADDHKQRTREISLVATAGDRVKQWTHQATRGEPALSDPLPVYTPRRLSNLASDPSGTIASSSLKTILSTHGQLPNKSVTDYRVMVLMAMSGLTLSTSVSSRHDDQLPLQPTAQEDLSPDQLAVLKEVFQKFDVNSDGTISASELAEALQLAGLSFTEDEMRHVIRQVDANNSGDIDFPEFLTLMTRHVSQTIDDSGDKLNDIVFREANGTDKQFVPSADIVPTGEVEISHGAHESVINRGLYSKGTFKVMHDREKGMLLGDKKFVFYQREELAMSRELQTLVKFFDRELSLFNDCRTEQGRLPLYEMHMTFPPTFALDDHQARDAGFIYSESRCPSWCDRVLMNKAAEENITKSRSATSDDLATLGELLAGSPPSVAGTPSAFHLTHTAGNIYGAIHTHKIVSDHAAVLLLVNLT